MSRHANGVSHANPRLTLCFDARSRALLRVLVDFSRADAHTWHERHGRALRVRHFRQGSLYSIDTNVRAPDRCDGAAVQECDGRVRGSSAGLSDRTLGPSDSRTGPSDSRTGPSHRRTLAPSHRTISLNNDVAAFPSFIDMNVESRRLEKRTTSRRQPRSVILLGNQAIVAHAPPMVFILLIAAHEAKPTRPS